MPDERPPDVRELGIYLTLGQVGFEMVVPLIIGLVIDYYADTSPWFTVSGTILGFVGGVAHLVVLSKMQDAIKRQRNKPGNGVP